MLTVFWGVIDANVPEIHSSRYSEDRGSTFLETFVFIFHVAWRTFQGTVIFVATVVRNSSLTRQFRSQEVRKHLA
jgi:hypothetical protein